MTVFNALIPGVRDLLAHASILTTERYDSQRLEALQAGAARLEAGKAIDAAAEAADGVSRIFEVPTDESSAECGDPPARILRNS